LSETERRAAAVIPRALGAARALAEAGETDPSALGGAALGVLETEPAFRLQYLEIRDAETLAPARGSTAGKLLVAVAGHVGGTRLIDNDVIAVPAPHKPARQEEVAHVP
ncbi:MAG TPA: pantoate--beta-alanine ligase, partial [bacterium]|nr:pantoate--beta-alanine ligase [bacterium]